MSRCYQTNHQAHSVTASSLSTDHLFQAIPVLRPVKWAHYHTSQCCWWWESRKTRLSCFTGFPLKLYMAYFHKYNFIKLIFFDNPRLNAFVKAVTSFWNYFPNFSTERNPQSISDSALGYLPGRLWTSSFLKLISGFPLGSLRALLNGCHPPTPAFTQTMSTLRWKPKLPTIIILILLQIP